MAYSDDDLLLLFNDRNERGFLCIYEKYWMYVYHFLLRHGLSTGLAKEFAVQIFRKLFLHRYPFESITNIKVYLITTSRSIVYEYLNSSANVIVQPKNQVEGDESKAVAYNEEIEQETLRLVMERIDDLPNHCRLIFIMSFLAGYSNSKIAATLNLSERTVGERKKAARQLLKMNIPLSSWLRGIGHVCTLIFCLFNS